jgi:hypothetical protein
MNRIQQWKRASPGRRVRISVAGNGAGEWADKERWEVVLCDILTDEPSPCALGYGPDLEAAWADAVARYEARELEIASATEASPANHERDGREVA